MTEQPTDQNLESGNKMRTVPYFWIAVCAGAAGVCAGFIIDNFIVGAGISAAIGAGIGAAFTIANLRYNKRNQLGDDEE